MRRPRFVTLAAAAALTTLATTTLVSVPATAGATTATAPRNLSGRVIVKLRGVQPGAATAAATGAPTAGAHPLGDGATTEQVPAGTDPAAFAAHLASDPHVAYAAPDLVMHPTATPTDSYFGYQWDDGPVTGHGAGFTNAWDITKGSAAVTVAVLDTGYTLNTDLAPRLARNTDNSVAGADFVSDPYIANDGDARDVDASDPGDGSDGSQCPASSSSYHGTHTAGTIGAVTNNAYGVAGGDWRARILPVRVLGRCGGLESDIADGLRWAAGLHVDGMPDNPTPAKIANLSIGGYDPSGCDTTMQGAVDAATAAGTIVVVAAGNDTVPAQDDLPANCNNVISVAASTRSGALASYSNYGSTVTLAAPGGDASAPDGTNAVLSTWAPDPGTGDDQFAFMAGTSMAAPHVAAAVSLMAAIDPTITEARAQAILRASAHPMVAGECPSTAQCVYGTLDAAGALKYLGTQVLAPHAPPTVTAGFASTFTWNTTVPLPNVRVDLVVGKSVFPVAASVAASANTLRYTAPVTLPGGLAYVRLTTLAEPYLTVVSPAGRAVATTITAAAPLKGARLTRGHAVIASWSYTGRPAATVQVELWRAGTRRAVLTSAVGRGQNGTGAWRFIVPNVAPATNYQLRFVSTIVGTHTAIASGTPPFSIV